MPLFSTDNIRRFFDQGERLISSEKDFVYDRVSLEITAGEAYYTLPEYTKSIVRVTYMGNKLDPLPARNFRDVFQSATQQGTPFWYVYNNIGANTIQLFPRPGTSLATIIDVWNTDGTNEWLNACVVEFARIADTTSFYIPLYLRRQLLKYYTAAQCYQIDGSGQNLKLAKYFNERWEFKKTQFENWLDEMHSKPRKLIVSEITSSNYFPAAPILPIDRYGIGVDTGY